MPRRGFAAARHRGWQHVGDRVFTSDTGISELEVSRSPYPVLERQKAQLRAPCLEVQAASRGHRLVTDEHQLSQPEVVALFATDVVVSVEQRLSELRYRHDGGDLRHRRIVSRPHPRQYPLLVRHLEIQGGADALAALVEGDVGERAD